MIDVFISYARKDGLSLAKKLHAKLFCSDFSVWFDQEDIPLAVDFQDRINEGILRSNNFLFLITPESIQSVYCRKEIELAVRMKKRLIPILVIEPERELLKKFMHPKIGKINWVFMRENLEDLDLAIDKVMELLSFHASYVSIHTQLLVKSQAWKSNNKPDDLLLFGKERQEAQAWLKVKFTQGPAPVEITNLQCEYIAQSRRLAELHSTDIFLISDIGDSYWSKKIKYAFLQQGITLVDRDDYIPGVLSERKLETMLVGAKQTIFIGS
ncbi:MAG: hypothetical protein RIS47_460, partial [Bacteroidota bacterium]